jgi:hypothetical protein
MHKVHKIFFNIRYQACVNLVLNLTSMDFKVTMVNFKLHSNMKNVISLFYKFYTVLHHFPQKISMYHNFAQQIYIFILKKLE